MGIPLSGISATLGTPLKGDQANAVISGSFVGTGVSSAFVFYGSFNVAIYGSAGPNGAWSGSVQLEKSYDGGTTFIVCGVGGAGQQAVYAAGLDVSFPANELERGVIYHLRCTAYVSGPINYRLSATGVLGTTNGIQS